MSATPETGDRRYAADYAHADAGQAMMQVWEAETGTDFLVLREVLRLAAADPDVAGRVLEALYAQCDQHDRRTASCQLCDIMTRAEEAPLLVEVPA